MSIGGPEQEGSLPGLSADEAANLAGRYGLEQVGIRPRLGVYLKDVWRHRSFLMTMSSADFVARHQQNYLGQIWSILNPLLLGAAYYIVFGLILDTRQGTGDDYVPFLMIGLFSFIFIAAGMNHGAKSLIGNMNVVRALRFPRVVLPISVVMTELFAAAPAFLVAAIIAVITGQSITWSWLLYPVAIAIVFVMTTGIAMIAAAFVYRVRDAANLTPLITRMLRYVSGVFFSVAAYTSGVAGFVMQYQPVAVVLTMLRQTLLDREDLTWAVWLTSIGWAVGLFIIGFIVFWRAEATYGRQ
ncbi:MAG: ABC transporter permease [Ornithinimicrobium sp.]